MVVGTKIGFSILWVGVKHEYLVNPDQIIDDPYPASLTATTPHPSDLTQSSGLGYEVASFRIGHEHGLKRHIGLVVDEFDNSCCEYVSLITGVRL